MSNTPSASNKGAIASSAATRVKAASPHPASNVRLTLRRRYILIVSFCFFVALSLGLLMVMTTEFPMSLLFSRVSSQTTQARPDNELRLGKVVSDSRNNNGCRQKIFDNQIGRVTETEQPCEDAAFDSNGRPILRGTIRRLDAISKSFSNR